MKQSEQKPCTILEEYDSDEEVEVNETDCSEEEIEVWQFDPGICG